MELSGKGFLKRLFHKNYGSEQETAKHAVRNLCIHCIFLLVATIIAMSSREIGMYHFNDTIDKILLQHPNAVEVAYEDIVTIDDWWLFAKNTFLKSIDQLNNKSLQNKSAFGGHVLFGVPRLRQIRVQGESCRLHSYFENKFETCYGHYSKSKEDINGFLNSTYYTQSEVKTYTVWGSITNYHGSGYIEMLTYDKTQNGDILSALKDANWLDRGSRVVLMELVLLNADVNLFCNVKLMAEIPATGSVITSSHFQSLKYSLLWNDDDRFGLFWAILFVCLIIYFTFDTGLKIICNGLMAFFSSIFNIMDMVVLATAYTSMAYVIWHEIHIKWILDRYLENGYQYITLDVICFWNLLFMDMVGICIFIVWIKVLKYIKFNKTMLQFSNTLQRCAKDIFGFSIMFFIVFVAYANLSVLWLGTINSNFCNFSTALLSLMATVLGDFDYKKMEAANRILGPIFLLTFILVVFFILLNMFLAIINDTYSDVKSDITYATDNLFEEYIRSLLLKLKNYVLSSKTTNNESDQNIENEPDDETTSLEITTSYQEIKVLSPPSQGNTRMEILKS